VQLARSLTALSRHAEARAAAARGEALSPTDAWTLDTLGVVHSRTGLHERALPLFRRAVALEPGNPAYQQNLGTALQFAGDVAGAEAAFRAAVAGDPGLYRAWWSITQLAKQTPDRNVAAQLAPLFPARPEDDPDRALHVGHALAKTAEDLGDDAGALAWLGRAKAARRVQAAYDPARDAALFAAAARTAGPPAEGASDAAPIFVVGLPRTGTTLVDRIISSHPAAVSVGERTDVALILKRMAATPGALVLDESTLDAAGALDLAQAGRRYLEAMAPLADGRRTVDKMPLNILYAGLIHRMLPNARIVCLRRHPMDAALANYRQMFATRFPYYDYAYGLEDTAAYVAGFEALADRWAAVLPRDRYTELRYEALVADQEGETRRLLAHCGLDWDPATLAFHENAAPVATPSALQVRQPIHAGSVGRWRRLGDALEPMAAVFRKAGIEI
ncbi:MAG: sulfotransferase, partial [Pseudomonadota bacterium]